MCKKHYKRALYYGEISAERTYVRDPLDRFMARADMSNDDACWLWKGTKDRWGYGQMSVGGKTMKAYKYSYQLEYGPIPDGLWVLHRCNVRACVNPRHLYLGTHADNMRDMAESGNMKGERQGRHKLTNATVREARAAYASGASILGLAKRYGVSWRTMAHAVKGETWRHVESIQPT